MDGRPSKSLQAVLQYEEEFRVLLARHHIRLPEKKSLTGCPSRSSVSLCLDVITDSGDHLHVVEPRHPQVYTANLSLSFRNQPRLSMECYQFDWVFEESDDEGVKFTNIGESLISLARQGGAGLGCCVGGMRRKKSFRQLRSQIVRGLLDSGETVTYSLLNSDGNHITDLLGGGKKIQFMKDKTGQFGVRNLLENRLTSQQQLEKVLEKFSNVSADEIIKFR